MARLVLGLMLLLVGAACAGGAAGSGDGGTAPGPMSADEFEAIYQARADSARMRFTDADVQFVVGMIGHHTQALVMAELVPERSTTPAIQTLAARIINAQHDEIASMQQWLRDRRQEVPTVHVQGVEIHIPSVDHMHHMPGMITAEEMSRLSAARGTEFDRLFLTFMIQHHRGAVTMVEELVATDGAAQDIELFKLASDIQVDQTTEINRMATMLARMDRSGELRM